MDLYSSSGALFFTAMPTARSVFILWVTAAMPTARRVFTLLLFTLLLFTLLLFPLVIVLVLGLRLAFFIVLFSLNMLAVLLERVRARKNELGLKSGGRESHLMCA